MLPLSIAMVTQMISAVISEEDSLGDILFIVCE